MDTHAQHLEKDAPLPGPLLEPVWRQVAGLGRLRGWACLARLGRAEGLPWLKTPSSRSGNTCGRSGGFCCHDSSEDPAAGQGDRPSQAPSVPVTSALWARASRNGGCTAQQPLDLTWKNLAPGGGVCRDTATSGADGPPVHPETGLTVWPSAVWQEPGRRGKLCTWSQPLTPGQAKEGGGGQIVAPPGLGMTEKNTEGKSC